MLIVARLAQTSPENRLEDQLGYAMIPIDKSSIIGSPQLKTFSGKSIEKSGFFQKLTTVRYSQRMQIQIRCMDVNPSGQKAVTVVSDGRVLVIDLAKGVVVSRFDDQNSQDDSKSDLTSIDAMSVVSPLDLQMVNWAQWMTDDLLLMTNLQGGLSVMTEGTWKNILGDDWIQFDEGVCVSAYYDDKHRIHSLIINDKREWMKNYDEQNVLIHHYSLRSMNQVNPWEKFIHCIELREYGEAIHLANEHQYDTDLVFGFDFLFILDINTGGVISSHGHHLLRISATTVFLLLTHTYSPWIVTLEWSQIFSRFTILAMYCANV